MVEGENLDVLIGNRPLKVEPADDASDEEKAAAKEPVKAFALKLLEEKYGIAEEDFLSGSQKSLPPFPLCLLQVQRLKLPQKPPVPPHSRSAPARRQKAEPPSEEKLLPFSTDSPFSFPPCLR